MSGIHRTKIEWADATWNPVSGCLHGCPYCYARNQARRFQPKPSEWPEPNTVKVAAHDERCFIETKPTVLRDADGKYLRSTPYPRGFAPTMHTYKLGHLKTATAPRRIFVGSMTDLFGDWVPDEWLAAIFRECYEAPQHVYIFLTKNPKRYADLQHKHLLPEGDNYWWGTSVTTNAELERIGYLPIAYGRRFISVEPLMEAIDLDSRPLHVAVPFADWVIIGAMTGPSASKHRPEADWVLGITRYCEQQGVPVFLKDSLTAYKDWSFAYTPGLRQIPQEQTAHISKVKIQDWEKLDAHKVFVEHVRDEKECRQCGADVRGKPAWRISGRFYICEECYKGGAKA
jgi:protein gp37